MTVHSRPDHEVLVIGAGFSGIGAAIGLRRAGLDDFVVVDERDDVGGTWYVNTYPGIAVDITAFSYSFAFEPFSSWSRVFPPGAELKAYADHCVDKYGIRPRLRLNAKVVRAEYDESAHLWRVFLRDGAAITARFVICATGWLTKPKWPNIDGLARFQGTVVHTAEWDQSLNLAGRRVGLIGTGASAVQVVPEIAPRVARLYAYQRTPIWLFPKPDFGVPKALRRLFRTAPWLQRAIRLLTDAVTELSFVIAMVHNRQFPFAALRRRQEPAGYWKGEFETSLIGDAADVILHHYLRLPGDAPTAAAKTILGEQSATGGWATYYQGPDDLLLSVFCYVALRLAGYEPDDPALRAAAESIRGNGGIESVNNPTMLAWLSLVGLWPWRDIPLIPPEIILLPTWFPGNIYQIGAAARGVVVADSLFMARRPVTPAGFDIGELYARPDAQRRLPRRRTVRIMTALSHWYARHPIGFLRRRAIRKATEWLIGTQERDGSWGGNWPQIANVVVGLDAVGYQQDHPVIQAAMTALDQYVVTTSDGQRRVEMWTSVVMDTALALSAAAMAARPGMAAATGQAVRWLLDNQVTELGDWAVLTKNPVAGGWPYEFANNANPDADDTAFALTALRRVHPRGANAAVDAACERASQWLESQQNRDGGWAAFEPLRWRLPGRDALARIGFLEAPSADITGHVLEALGANGQAGSSAARRGVEWLRRHQHPDGSWPGWWACYHLHGTSAAVTGLTSCGVAGADPTVRKACDWIVAHQQDDGGWGEDIRALHDPAWIGTGASTPSQTSWALLALIAAGRAESEPVRAGLDFLIRTQQTNGDWAEPWHTWVVHHDGLYWRDSMLRLVYPIMVMSGYLARAGGPVRR